MGSVALGVKIGLILATHHEDEPLHKLVYQFDKCKVWNRGAADMRELANALCLCPNTTTLKLRANSNDTTALWALMNVVNVHPSLTQLDAAYNMLIGPMGCGPIVNALKESNAGGSKLKSLSVHTNPLEEGASVIIYGLLTNRTLTHLDLTRTSMTKTSFDMLTVLTASSPTLRHLSVAYNPRHMTSKVLASLGKNMRALHTLDLSGTFTDASMDTAEGLSLILTLPKTLQTLVVACNQINDTQMVLIAAALKTNTTLKKLNLQKNSIGNTGAIALSEAIMENEESNLSCIQLDNNRIGDTGGIAICNLLRASRPHGILRHMHLEGNRLSDASSEAFLSIITEHLELYSLTLNRNYFTEFSKFAAAYSAHPSIFENYSALQLSEEERKILQSTFSRNRLRHNDRKHVALLMGTHTKLGSESAVYNMYRSPIYDPHILGLVFSFVPNKPILQYNMDLGITVTVKPRNC